MPLFSAVSLRAPAFTKGGDGGGVEARQVDRDDPQAIRQYALFDVHADLCREPDAADSTGRRIKISEGAVTELRLFAPAAARNRDPDPRRAAAASPSKWDSAGDRQRQRRARRPFRRPPAWADVPAERPQAGGQSQHRRLGRVAGARQCASGDGAGRHRSLATGSRGRGPMHQHDPHLALARDDRVCCARRPGCCHRGGCSISTAPIAKAAPTPPQATRHSTETCGHAIHPGASATWRR